MVKTIKESTHYLAIVVLAAMALKSKPNELFATVNLCDTDQWIYKCISE